MRTFLLLLSAVLVAYVASGLLATAVHETLSSGLTEDGNAGHDSPSANPPTSRNKHTSLMALEAPALAGLILSIWRKPPFDPEHVGRGRPVMVIPGFLANDASTVLLRRTLEKAGFRAFGWGMGVNKGARADTLDRLGELFRYTLESGEKRMVRLADEWRFVRDYLGIEQIRLGSRLRAEMEMDPSLAECEVPVTSLVIGEGGSGGALAIGCANRMLIMENAVYYVASPEACAPGNQGRGIPGIRPEVAVWTRPMYMSEAM